MQSKATRRLRSVFLLTCLSFFSLLVAACGDLVPQNAKIDDLLINEVYTGEAVGNIQWIELLNNTNNELNLAGYKLVTRYGTVELGGAAGPRAVMPAGSAIVFSNFPDAVLADYCNFVKDSVKDDPAQQGKPVNCPRPPIQERTILGKLNPEQEVIVVKNASDVPTDQVGWGTADPALRTQVGAIGDTNLSLPSPKSATRSLGRIPYQGQTSDPVDPNKNTPGRINPGDFGLHNTRSPGVNAIPASAASFHFILRTATDIISTLGALLLWLVFVYIALVARRFETLSEQRTYWQWLMIAPIGIFIYAVIQVLSFIFFNRLPDSYSWPAFLALFLSGLACLYVINIFRLIAKNILEAQ